MSISLCVIARDEETFLPDCLRSVEGVVEKIIVVDTGSHDQTARIARDAGAIVIPHTWNDDFSAARNAALEVVSTPYVLLLDADERLARGAGRVLKKLAKKGRVELGLLPLHNAMRREASEQDVIAGTERRGDPILLARFFRNTDGLRWEGAIHENVDAWARQPGRVIRAVEAPIIHLGAIPEIREALGKDRRNLEMLERRCRAEPDHPVMGAHLAREYERTGDLARAEAEAERAWQALLASEAKDPGRYEPILPTTLLVGYRLHRGRIQDALQILETARSLSEPHPNLDFLEAEARRRSICEDDSAEKRKEELEQSLSAYQAALSRSGHTFTAEVIEGATGDRSRLGLASTALALGDHRAAQAALAGIHEDSEEATLLQAELCIALDRGNEALTLVEVLAQQNHPDAWFLCAQAAALLGSAEDVVRFAARGREAENTNATLEPRRRERVDRLCEPMDREPRRVFAWPHWQDCEELDGLIRDYGALLCEHESIQLFLHHDPKLDGSYEEAVSAVERAYAAYLPERAVLDVVMLTEAPDANELHRLSAPGDIALELPSSSELPRRTFITGLKTSTVSDPAALARVLRGPRWEAQL